MSCSNCKHWERDGIAHEYQNDDECTWSEAAQRRCLRIVGNGISRLKPEESVPFMTDADQRGASLWTPAAFGCSLYEPREGQARNPALDYREFGITEL